MIDSEQLRAEVEAAQRGDGAAIQRLVEEFRSTAVGTATRLVGNPVDAEDIAQEALSAAVARIADLRDPAAFPGWLTRIVMTHADRRTRRRDSQVDPTRTRSDDDDPASATISADDFDRLWRQVEQLPVELRHVVALADLAGLSQPTVAEMLGVPVSTVVHRRRAARRRLRGTVETSIGRDLPALRDLPVSVRFFLALRAGDLVTVSTMVTERPSLLEAEEQWTPALASKGIVPFANRGTPLLRSIERGDRNMVALLLRLGANVDAPCGCPNSESPLWTAVAHGRHDHVETLLEAGASPNATSASGTTALHIAAGRGDARATLLLLAWGAARDITDAGNRTPLDWAIENHRVATIRILDPGATRRTQKPARPQERAPAFETGIRAVDLFAPIARGHATLVVPRPYVGHAVLLVEISRRLADLPNTAVVWCGFAQPPYDRVDVDVQLREGGIAHRVPMILPDPAGSDRAARELLDRTTAIARLRAERDGTDVVLVVLSAKGTMAAVERALADVGRFGSGSVTAIVVAPIVDAGDAGDAPLGPPWSGRIVYDADRAARREWPAVSWRSDSSLADPVAGDLRRRLASAGSDETRDSFADAVHAWLIQPFAVVEAFNARPGEHTDAAETIEMARNLVERAATR